MRDIIDERLAKLDDLDIYKGNHSTPPNGTPVGCVMELASWIVGEEWSDKPKCACPVITSFMIGWNDRLPDNETRNRLLKPLLSVVVNTRSTPEVEAQRRQMLRDWAWGTALPRYLEAAKLHDVAAEVADNPGDKDVILRARRAAWDARKEWREKLRAKVTAAVKESLADKPVAVAVAVADAAADADAAAAAVAVADAAAAAVVRARWGDWYWRVRGAVYDAVKAKYQEIFSTDERFAFIPELQASAQQLVRDMAEVTE